jgi:hypothetical protein
MKSIRTWHDRTLALALISSLAACGPGEQQAQIEEPVAAQPSESAVMAATETAEIPEMPEMLDMSGKFADMFITDITSDFNPGLQIGDQFPAIRAMYEGEEVRTIDRFIRDKGAIFIAARSVEW